MLGASSSDKSLEVPLRELQKEVGSCPFVKGATPVWEVPGGQKTLFHLNNFERVKILKIQGAWFYVQRMTSRCETPVGAQGWIQDKDLKFVTFQNNDASGESIRVFGHLLSDPDGAPLRQVRAWVLPHPSYPLLLFFPATEMTAGFFAFVGDSNVLKYSSEELGGRLARVQLREEKLIFKTDALCFQNVLYYLPLSTLLPSQKTPKFIPVIDGKVFRSAEAVFAKEGLRSSKTVLVQKEQEYRLVGLRMVPATEESPVRERMEIEILPSHQRLLLDANSLEMLAPQGLGQENEQIPLRSCAG